MLMSLFLRRNWKLVAGLVVADFVLGKVQKARRARKDKAASNAGLGDGEESLKVSLRDLVDKEGHNRGSLAV